MNPEDLALPPHRSIRISADDPRLAQQSAAPAPNASSSLPESALSAEYRRLMRWYPRHWRAAHEEAMLGALLDQAEHEHRDRPTPAERISLTREGLAQWFGIPRRGPQRLRLVPLATGAALSVFYGCFIIWSPQTDLPGSFGPFSNPSIITCIVLVLAFLAAVIVRGPASNILALGAAVAEVVIGILAAMHPELGPDAWQGPSGGTVVLFAGLALLGGTSLRRGWLLVAGALIVLAATATVTVASFVNAELGHFSLVSVAMTSGIVVAVCAAAAVLIRGLRREKRTTG